MKLITNVPKAQRLTCRRTLATAIAGIAVGFAGANFLGDSSTAVAQQQGQQQQQQQQNGQAEVAEVVAEGEHLNLSKQMPEQVRLGSEFTYTINIENVSDGDLAGVKVMEALPEGFEVRSAEPQPQRSEDGRTLTFPVGHLPQGESRQVKVTGVAQSAGSLQLCTTYDFQRGICAPLAVVNPQLSVQRTAPETASICEPVTLTYVIRNDGSTPAENVQLFEQLPEGLATDGGREIGADLGTIEPGQEVTREVTVRAERELTYENYAAVNSAVDKVQTRRSAIQFIAPDLEVQIQPTSDWTYMGKNAQFEVIVKNVGQGDAMNTAIGFGAENGEIARVGAGEYAQEGDRMASTRMGGEQNTEGFAMGNIPAGETKRFFVEVNTEQQGEVTVAAAVQALCGQDDMVIAEAASEASVAVAPITALQLEVVDKVDPVQVGEQTTYEIAVLNEGSADDSNLQLTAELPEGFSFVSGEGASEVSGEGRNVTIAPLQALPAGETAVWYVNVRAGNAAGQGRMNVTLNSETLPEGVTSQEPTRAF